MNTKGRGMRERELVEVSEEMGSSHVENEACDVYKNLTDLTSQVQMMSDSLLACRQMSKYRSLRKTHKPKGNSQPDTAEASAPQIPVRALISPGQSGLDGRANDEETHVIVSYMMQEMQNPGKSKNSFGKGSNWGRNECSRQMERSWDSEEETSRELSEESSEIRMYPSDEVDAGRMLHVVQRELQTLKEMAPSAADQITALSCALFHYKECVRCLKKISPSLPWFLTRVQKLVEYVTTKRKGKYRWPNDYSYLRLRDSQPTKGASKSPSKEFERLVGKLEKIEVFPVPEDQPGLQLLLEVKPKKTKKRFFQQIENHAVGGWDSESFSVVELRESGCVPVVQVLVPGNKPRILLDEKREAAQVKETAHRFPVVFAFQTGYLASVLVLVPLGRARKERKPISFRKTSEVALDKVGCRDEAKSIKQGKRRAPGSNEKKSFSPRKLVAKVPEIVEEFLQEAEKEKMYDQKVQSLETGVKGLRTLMAEIHKNQILLSKVLLEKNILSQPIIKLTDPNMLDRERELVRKVEEIHVSGTKRSSVEALQVEVDSLKQKCGLKNRLIQIILKGLESNIPKEWWEDMVEYVFDQSKPIEDFDPTRVNEFLQRVPGLHRNGEKESRHRVQPQRSEDHATEEEPKVSGIVGADVEEGGLKAKTHEVTSLDDFDEFPKKALASASDSPNTVSSTIMKLENQVSLLNTQNERLWHEVHDLQTLLKTSVNSLQERRISHAGSEQNAGATNRSLGKTINLTIQIVGKDFRRVHDGGFPCVAQLSEVSGAEGAAEEPRSQLALECVGPEALTEAEELEAEVEVEADVSVNVEVEEGAEGEEAVREQSVGVVTRKAKNLVRWKSESRRPEKSQSDVEEELMMESKKVNSMIRERALASQLTLTTPHPSGHELLQKWKPVVWVPSKYNLPEVSGGHRVGGPSGKAVDVGYLLQKPSLMELAESQSPGMFGTMANERELQTIPENDSGPSSCSPKGITQAIQQLRTRVRSIHKDVTVLKSKNDRIDKLLDRLVDDAVDNSESFDEMEKDLKRMKNQLG